MAQVLPFEANWVLGIEMSLLNDACGAVGMSHEYDEQGHPPNVLLAARATTN